MASNNQKIEEMDMRLKALENRKELARAKSIARRHALKAQGKYASGVPPFGFAPGRDTSGRPTNELVRVTEEYTVLLEIIDLKQSGFSASQITRWLNDHGRIPRRGNRWHQKVVSRIIQRFEATK